MFNYLVIFNLFFLLIQLILTIVIVQALKLKIRFLLILLPTDTYQMFTKKMHCVAPHPILLTYICFLLGLTEKFRRFSQMLLINCLNCLNITLILILNHMLGVERVGTSKNESCSESPETYFGFEILEIL